MACALKKSNNPAVDFEGSIGAKAQLSVRATGDDAAAVELDFIRYCGQTIHTDPAPVKIAAGRKPLIIGLRGTVDGQIGFVVEVCGDGTENRLARIKFVDLDPVRNFVLEGK